MFEVAGVVAFLLGAWQVGQLGFLVLLAHMAIFAGRRFAGRGLMVNQATTVAICSRTSTRAVT